MAPERCNASSNTSEGFACDELASRTVDVDAFCSWSACNRKMRSMARARVGEITPGSQGLPNIMCKKLAE